jgi:hypothetical protein
MNKKTLIALAPVIAALGLTAASPAQAHETGHTSKSRYEQRHVTYTSTPYRNADIRSDIAQLQRDINRAERRGTISHREARALTRKADNLKALHARYARGGLTAYEMRTLDARLKNVRVALREERRDRDGRRG